MGETWITVSLLILFALARRFRPARLPQAHPAIRTHCRRTVPSNGGRRQICGSALIGGWRPHRPAPTHHVKRSAAQEE